MEQEQPIPEELRVSMNAIGKVLQNILYQDLAFSKEKYGFALFIFNFGQGDDHRISYISNAMREDMLATLKEFIAKAEGRYHGA